MPANNYFYNPNSSQRSKNPRFFTRLFRAVRHVDFTQLYVKQEVQVEQEKGLARVLTLVDLIAYGISVTVGAGIFVTTGAATLKAGPAVVLSYLIAAFASFFSALCFGEFAARIPVSGSAYTFSYVSLGEFVAWIIGWSLTLEYGVSASALARTWAEKMSYLVAAFGGTMPAWLGVTNVGSLSISPLSATILILCTVVLLVGARESSLANVCMMLFNITVLIFIIVMGSIFFDSQNLTPFAPNGAAGIFEATITVFFSYIGFDGVTTLAGEVRNPGRDMPLGVMGTLLAATLLYLGATLVLVGMVPISVIDKDAAISGAFRFVGVDWASNFITVGTLTIVTATTFTSLMGQPRIFFQMAKDGLLPKAMMYVNAQKVPWVSTLVTGILAIVLAVFMDTEILVNFISVGTLLAFAVVCGGTLLLRYRRQDSLGADVSRHLNYGIHSRVEIIARIASRFLGLNLLLWVVLSTFASIMYRNGVETEYYAILIVPLILSVFGFAVLKSHSLPETFACPFVPYVPLIGIFVNILLVGQQDIPVLLGFLIWTAVGIMIYFIYGFWHSELRKGNTSNNNIPEAPSTFEQFEFDESVPK